MRHLPRQLDLSTERLPWLAWLLWLALLGAVPGYGQTVLPVPALAARVIDQTATLSTADRQNLEAKLAAFEQARGTQIVVLMVPTTQPEAIESYANRVANAWKIGRRDIGDGLLVIVAKDDRRMRIEVAKALEGPIPDLAAVRIIDRQMMPRFRAGDFAGGLDAAVEQLMALVKGENLPIPEPNARRAGSAGQMPVDWVGAGLFLLIGTLMIGSLMRRMFGKVLGPLFAGGVAGGLTFLLTASVLFAALAGLVGRRLRQIDHQESAQKAAGAVPGVVRQGLKDHSSPGVLVVVERAVRAAAPELMDRAEARAQAAATRATRGRAHQTRPCLRGTAAGSARARPRRAGSCRRPATGGRDRARAFQARRRDPMRAGAWRRRWRAGGARRQRRAARAEAL